MGNLTWQVFSACGELLACTRYCIDAARLAMAVNGTVGRDGRRFKVPPGLAPVEVADVWLTELGSHPLRDLPRPERVVQLCHPDLVNEFPPLRVSKAVVSPHLPVQLTSFIGRDDDLDLNRDAARQRTHPDG